MLALGTQPLCCREMNLPPTGSRGGEFASQPCDRGILEEYSSDLVKLPSWHLVEQRWIVPTEPWPNGTSVSKINDCCFMPLSFEVVCYIGIDGWNISLEYELAVYFALANEMWKKWWRASSEPCELLFHLCSLPLEPLGGWELCAQMLIAPASSHPASRNVSPSQTSQPPINWLQMHEQASQAPPILAQTRASLMFLLLG